MHKLTKIKEICTTEIGKSTLVCIEAMCSCSEEPLKYDRYVDTAKYVKNDNSILLDMGKSVFNKHAETPPEVKPTVFRSYELSEKQIEDLSKAGSEPVVKS